MNLDQLLAKFRAAVSSPSRPEPLTRAVQQAVGATPTRRPVRVQPTTKGARVTATGLTRAERVRVIQAAKRQAKIASTEIARDAAGRLK